MNAETLTKAAINVFAKILKMNVNPEGVLWKTEMLAANVVELVLEGFEGAMMEDGDEKLDLSKD